MEKQTERMVADSIRNQYVEHKETKLEELQKLDSKVKRPAQVFAFVFGSIGALVLGVGMCLAMKVIGDMMPLGIVVGCVGIAMVSINYLIFKKIEKSRKDKYSNKVLSLTDELLNK